MNMHLDFNSDIKSNLNTDGRTDERYEESPPAESKVTGCNARARMAESGAMTVSELLAEGESADRNPPTEEDAQRLARLLGERERRHMSSDGDGRTISQVLDTWLERMELNNGRRWPVIRTGEREPIPWVLRASILSRDGETCKSCGIHDVEFELDHCIPWSAGGPDDSDNLRTLCRRCNQERSNYIDNAHAQTLLPTTYWCIDCWTYEDHRPRRHWKDWTDLSRAPWVAGEEGGPMRLAYCAWCRYISTTDVYFVGEMGRRLVADATELSRKIAARKAAEA